jgi:hypothetical protein
MIIRDELLQEHSRKQALRIARYACSSQANFRELMQCFLGPENRVAQRAAWSVSWAALQQPEMIQPYIKDLVACLKRTDIHPALIRNSVRVLEQVDIPEKFHGDLMNACFGFIETPATPPAIKAFSLTILFRLSDSYPEIRQELKLIIENNWEREGPAFKSRGRKILAALGKHSRIRG